MDHEISFQITTSLITDNEVSITSKNMPESIVLDFFPRIKAKTEEFLFINDNQIAEALKSIVKTESLREKAYNSKFTKDEGKYNIFIK